MKREVLCSVEEMLISLYGGERDFNLSECDDLKELGVDSLSFIQLIIAIEKEYGFQFSDEALSQDELKKVSILIEYIESCCSKNK